MSHTPTVVMSIAGSDSGGGAGIEADIKTFAAINVHGTCAITAITAQNTQGVNSIFELPLNIIRNQIDTVLSDMPIKWVKTGMLPTPEIITEISNIVRKYNLSVVVDPVMSAEAGGDLMNKNAVNVLINELLPHSKVVTPNIYEASILSGITITNINDVKNAAKKIAEYGVEAVIITGGHLNASDIVYDSKKDEFELIPGDFVKGGTHGSGCTYAACITGYLSLDNSVIEAARLAKQFVEQAILHSIPVGKGVAPVNQLGYTLELVKKYIL